MIFVDIFHEYELVHVGVGIGVAQVLIVVPVEHIVLGLFSPIFLVQRLNLLILVIQLVLLLDLYVNSFVVVLRFGVCIFAIVEGHLTALPTTTFDP